MRFAALGDLDTKLCIVSRCCETCDDVPSGVNHFLGGDHAIRESWLLRGGKASCKFLHARVTVPASDRWPGCDEKHSNSEYEAASKGTNFPPTFREPT